jgi:hypothetical protein
MKISAIPSGMGGQPGVDLAGINVGRTASPEKLAAAKAIAAGETPIKVTQIEDPQLKRTQESVRRIKMRTQNNAIEPIATTESAKPDTIEQTAAVEVTKPISPQLAELAKQRRALQVKERELAEREKAITPGTPDLMARLKAEPLSVLQESGLLNDQAFYDAFTAHLLGNQSGVNPEIQALKAELKALKEGVDKSFQTQEERQEEAALTEMLYEAEALAKDGEAYEMIRSRDAFDRVLRLIHGTYKKTGRVMDVADAMNKVEQEVLDEALKLANINKVRGRLAPTQALKQQPQERTLTTLTNRDGAAVPLSRKARAMAAFRGQLKG